MTFRAYLNNMSNRMVIAFRNQYHDEDPRDETTIKLPGYHFVKAFIYNYIIKLFITTVMVILSFKDNRVLIKRIRWSCPFFFKKKGLHKDVGKNSKLKHFYYLLNK